MIKAGASQKSISPNTPQFLYGYPHVKRYSTGVYDDILSSSLYLDDGTSKAIIIANDIIFIPREMILTLREDISRSTGVPAENIMITCTHTHSAPITVKYISNLSDPAVPEPDPEYLELLKRQITASAIEAAENSADAQVGLAIADDTGVGTNRRDPHGAADHNVPVMMVKSQEGRNIACMLVCSMHPTVLHEDSTLVSGDFPGLSRRYLQQEVLGKDCVVLHHSGPCGNQSPRHVTKANTFEEAQRLGTILAKAAEKAIEGIEYVDEAELRIVSQMTYLPKRSFPSVERAREELDKAVERLRNLRENNASAKEIRTAECDWFGAEETLTLAKAAADGTLEKVYEKMLPAEIQLIKIGPWNFVGWQGEVFVEYALEVKERKDNTFVISVANGELQGYIVTEQASEEGGYEASNSLLSWKSGELLVSKTLNMLK